MKDFRWGGFLAGVLVASVFGGGYVYYQLKQANLT